MNLAADLSEDRQAIANYFSSDVFCRTKLTTDEYSRFAGQAALPSDSLGGSEAASLYGGMAGLYGLGVIFLGVIPMMVIGVSLYLPVIGQSTYLAEMLLGQSVLLAPCIVFTFTIVTSLLWCGSIFERMLMAMGALIPAVVAIGILLTLVESVSWDDFQESCLILLTVLMAIALVTVAIQMWTPWTLTHARKKNDALPTTDLQMILELTTVAAISFSIVASQCTEESLLTMAGCGGVGFLLALPTLGVVILFLQDRPLHPIIYGISVTMAIGLALFWNLGVAFQVSNGSVASISGWKIALATCYGALLIYSVMAVCLRWLHRCGWRCVNRRQVAIMVGAPISQSIQAKG